MNDSSLTSVKSVMLPTREEEERKTRGCNPCSIYCEILQLQMYFYTTNLLIVLATKSVGLRFQFHKKSFQLNTSS